MELEIPTDLVYSLFGIVFGGFGISIGTQLVSYGKLKQQAANTQEQLQEAKEQIQLIKARLDDGYTCKFHAEFAKEIGKIEGELKANRDSVL